jgi:PleD family two-component response regulator
MENTRVCSDKSDRTKGVVMVVDDTPENLRILEKMLTEYGYRVRATRNGSLALKSVQTSLPDLILLDIKMPEPDGYEICQLLKADEHTRDVPVIFISALDEVWDKVKAFHVGGIDYITKPFQTEEVIARIETHLTLQNLQKQLRETNYELGKRVQDLARSNEELQKALQTIKTLSGLIPICAWCGRRIRNEHNQWVQVESYIEAHTEAVFSHGICPDCMKRGGMT